MSAADEISKDENQVLIYDPNEDNYWTIKGVGAIEYASNGPIIVLSDVKGGKVLALVPNTFSIIRKDYLLGGEDAPNETE